MKSFTLSLFLAAATTAPFALADNFAVYNWSDSGNFSQWDDFDAAATRTVYTTGTRTYSGLVIVNLTTNTYCFLDTFLVGTQRTYTLEQTVAGQYSTTVFSAPYWDEQRFDQPNGTATVAWMFTTSFGAPELGGISEYALATPVQIYLPKAKKTIVTPASVTGSGLETSVDPDATNANGDPLTRIYIRPYALSYKINAALTDTAQSGTPVFVGGETLVPGTLGFAAYQTAKYLELYGYKLAIP